MRYVIYDPQIGQILSVNSSTYGISVIQQNSDVSDDTHYVVLPAGTIGVRPTINGGNISIPADGEPHVIVAGLPANTEVLVADVSQGYTPATLTMASVTPGPLAVTLRPPFPYRPKSFTVTFTEV